jgi:hypothetical protein
VKKPPSPLRGEGRGEGDVKAITGCYTPPPLNPLPLGEGKMTFYERVNLEPASFEHLFALELFEHTS